MTYNRISRLALSCFFLGILFTTCKPAPTATASAIKVQVVKPILDSVAIKKDFVGQVFGASDIPIRARVDGFLENVLFKEGSLVKKGRPLYIIDPLPSQQEVSASQSNYEEARAAYVQANNDLERIKPLAEINAVSQSDLDAAIASKEAAEKRVEAARANVNLSEINLSYTEILSPITGVIGKSEVEIGEYVGSSFNSIVLNTVSRIDTILVEFFLTEEDYLRFGRERIMLRERAEAAGMKQDQDPIDLELILSDGSIFEEPGKFKFLDRGVDPTTGTILIQAQFPNPDGLLRPGQFAKIRATVEILPNAIIVPTQCILETQGISNVKVVSESNVVELRSVILGPVMGDQVVVSEGLSATDRIIINGLQTSRNGSIVEAELIEFKSQSIVP